MIAIPFVIEEDLTREELILMLRPTNPLLVPGWFPLAPGWWTLILAIVIGISFWAIYSKTAKVRIRRQAIRLLSNIYERYGSHTSPRLVAGLSDVLRKVAIVSFGRANVAGLHGESWAEFLSKDQTIPRDLSGVIAYALYAPDGFKPRIAYSNEEIIKILKKWVWQNT